jgi:HPt (histidine-containing phosphotransfer) domain-containing protein
MTDLPILDKSSLDELAAAGPEFLTEMLELLLETGSKQVAEMSKCVAAQDMPALAKVAHSLKGASAGVGASELSQACAQLDHAAREGKSQAAPALLEAVTASFERVKNAVANILSDRS